MRLVMQVSYLLMQFFAIAFALAVQGSAGYDVAPVPETSIMFPPIDVHYLVMSPRSNEQTPESQPYVSYPPIALPSPQSLKAPVPSLSPSTSTVFPPYISAPPPSIVQTDAPFLPPTTPQRKSNSPVGSPLKNSPVSSPTALPVMPGSPLKNTPVSSPTALPVMPGPRAPIYESPVAGAVLPPEKLVQNPPAIHPVMPAKPPSLIPVSPTSGPPPFNTGWKMPVAAPPNENSTPLSPYPPSKGSFSAVPPSTLKNVTPSNNAPAAPVTKSFPNNSFQHPASSPLSPFHKNYHPRKKINGHAPIKGPATSPERSLAPLHPPERRHASPPFNEGPATSPERSLAPLHPPERRHASPPFNEGSSYPSPDSSKGHAWLPPSPSPTHRSRNVHVMSPGISPSGSTHKKSKTPPPLLVLALPPPPPNEDCRPIACTEPLTYTAPGSPCGCVWPMKVGLRFSASLFTVFPLVSELAQEIASGVFVKQSQVRITGATAATQEPEKSVVLIDIIPLGEKFDNTTAYLTYERFWHKQIDIKASFFGNYEVLYVQYPGLPPSPPSAPSSITVIDGGPNKGTMGKPFGVDVGRRNQKNGLSGSVIAIIVLSASIFAVLCSAVAWILIFKCTSRTSQPPPASISSIARPAGIAGSMVGSGPSSVSLGSSIPPYTGSTKTFSSGEIEKATDNFDSERIIGEGGFGRVYSGVLEDGTKVAVKIIKRDDQQGGREFLAEVEMLSRLHHRNLVKLIGMCIEEHNRCLVYELIANGSVESHLHGVDSETSPLDWATRMKIALGAARGLAYLHEDSSPRVIHRDFKSSNILLEEDFTPKVSDFGLARTAMDDDDNHISTRVMGTFGYVAPEYAMTGHLLVKSDVYSYGVVLLELLTGKKPIDMSQPPGDENLVSLARPLLTSKDGLESIIDPSLGSDVSFDSIAKFAAIASMCVQPEVSHRPFMGEVVQALKLICNECDEMIGGLRSRSQDYYSIDLDTRIDSESEYQPGTSQSQTVIADCDREVDVERGLSMSELFSRSVMHESGSFRRHSSSGPLRTRRGRQFWQRFGRLSSRGSMSGHHGTTLNS